MKMPDDRYSLCICPGCGWTGPKRPAEDGEASFAESFCCKCGYEVDAEPCRLPSVDELVAGLAGKRYSDVDLGAFVPALLAVLSGKVVS